MRIISLNIRGGINKKNKPYKIVDFLEKLNFDICLLQETSHIKPKNLSLLKSKLNVKITQSDIGPKKQNIGVATLVKENTQLDTVSVKNINTIEAGRLQQIDIKYKNTNITLYNIYGSTHTPDKMEEPIKGNTELGKPNYNGGSQLNFKK